MVTLEQVQLLDQRISKTIDYIKKVSDENALLKGRENSYKKRIIELEKQIKQINDDQGQIEEKFLSAFSRLNEIEDALGSNKEPSPSVPEMYVTQEPQDLSAAEPETPDIELDIF